MKRLLFFSKLFVATMMCIPFTAVAQVTIGLEDVPEKAALLDIKTHAPNLNNATTEEGGLLLPRVELTDSYSLAPFISSATADEKRRHAGLIVYNLTHNPAASLRAGIYQWDGEAWERMVTELPPVTSDITYLQTNLATRLVTGSANPSGDNNGDLMNFGTITIPVDGSYAFEFQLEGTIPGAAYARGIYYIKLFVNNTKTDSAEMNIYVRANGASYTYSVTLATAATAGDVITFKIIAYDTARPVWTLRAANTSMVWWKL